MKHLKKYNESVSEISDDRIKEIITSHVGNIYSILSGFIDIGAELGFMTACWQSSSWGDQVVWYPGTSFRTIDQIKYFLMI